MKNNETNNRHHASLRERIGLMTTFKWIKAGIGITVYLLFVIWIGNYWLLLGLPLVADAYITKYVPWGFWKRRKDGRKPSVLVEWIDALVFALVAVYIINLFLFQNYKIPTSSLEKSLLVGDHLFVSKVSYGPRMPNAPIFFPLVQNTLPLADCKSYVEWPMWGYKRLAGLGTVERNDIVVFNFPAGDTVCFNITNPDYYTILLGEGSSYLRMHPEKLEGRTFANSWERNHYLMDLGRKQIDFKKSAYGDIIWRPVDKRDNYVKRCIALPGDTLQIIHNRTYINGQPAEKQENMQHNYYVSTNGVTLNDKFFERLGISNEDRARGGIGPNYYLPLTEAKARQVAQMPVITSITMAEEQPDSTGMSVFPYSTDYPWSRDNYGPIWMPQKGARIALDTKNVMLYERIITAYEGNTLEVRDGRILINGQPADHYTFKMDYYFMLGDNRHMSADSRYWGFVPEDHIVGKPIFVWLSLDPDKPLLSSIRWNRFFMSVHP